MDADDQRCRCIWSLKKIQHNHGPVLACTQACMPRHIVPLRRTRPGQSLPCGHTIQRYKMLGTWRMAHYALHGGGPSVMIRKKCLFSAYMNHIPNTGLQATKHDIESVRSGNTCASSGDMCCWMCKCHRPKMLSNSMIRTTPLAFKNAPTHRHLTSVPDYVHVRTGRAK